MRQTYTVEVHYEYGELSDTGKLLRTERNEVHLNIRAENKTEVLLEVFRVLMEPVESHEIFLPLHIKFIVE